jgi:hypothetical protein
VSKSARARELDRAGVAHEDIRLRLGMTPSVLARALSSEGPRKGPTGEKMRHIDAYVRTETDEALKAIAREHSMSLAAVTREAIEAGLAQARKSRAA